MNLNRNELVKAAIGAGVGIWILYREHQRRVTPYVEALYIYPVKSCAEQAVETAVVTARGFEGDRRFQCTDASGKYCTPRDDDKKKLFKVRAQLEKEVLTLEAPGVNAMTLNLAAAKCTPADCEVLCVQERVRLADYGEEIAEWLQQATSIPGVRLTGHLPECDRKAVVNPDQGDPIPTTAAAPMSLADEAPFLLTSTRSLDDLNQRMVARGKAPVDMERFRPNIVVSNLAAWEEDCIRRFRVGGVEFWAWQRCGRCKMTTIDRRTLEHGPEPLATLSTFRERKNGQRNFGMHCIPVEGFQKAVSISAGSTFEILEFDEGRRAEWTKLFGGK